ncbi:hypothetical protein V8C26DRAFT_21526 [Trichoderma gracile]
MPGFSFLPLFFSFPFFFFCDLEIRSYISFSLLLLLLLLLPLPSLPYLPTLCFSCRRQKKSPFIAQRISRPRRQPAQAQEQQPQASRRTNSQFPFSRAPSSTASPAPTPLGESFLRPRPIRSAIGSLQSASSGRDIQRPIQATGAYPKHSPCPSLTLPALL